MSGRRVARRGAGEKKFNPRLISAQIVSMQCFHYLFLSFLFQVNYIFYGTNISLDRIFSDKYVELWTWIGWADNSAILLSSVFGSVLMAIIVEKSKKVLDFSLTLFLIHLIFCSGYDGMPATLDWWVIHVFGLILMTLLGEYLCSRKELDDIPLLQL